MYNENKICSYPSNKNLATSALLFSPLNSSSFHCRSEPGLCWFSYSFVRCLLILAVAFFSLSFATLGTAARWNSASVFSLSFRNEKEHFHIFISSLPSFAPVISFCLNERKCCVCHSPARATDTRFLSFCFRQLNVLMAIGAFWGIR